MYWRTILVKCSYKNIAFYVMNGFFPIGNKTLVGLVYYEKMGLKRSPTAASWEKSIEELIHF